MCLCVLCGMRLCGMRLFGTRTYSVLTHRMIGIELRTFTVLLMFWCVGAHNDGTAQIKNATVTMAWLVSRQTQTHVPNEFYGNRIKRASYGSKVNESGERERDR